MALQWSVLPVSPGKYPLSTIRHFPNELWSKKSEFSRFFRPSDTECLSYFHTRGIAGGSLLFFSTVASRPDVYNAHWMVAVRFFNLEFGSIKFLTSRVQDIQNSESNFQRGSNTLGGNTGILAALHVSTTDIGCVGVGRFSLGYLGWEQELWMTVLEVSSSGISIMVSRGLGNLRYYSQPPGFHTTVTPQYVELENELRMYFCCIVQIWWGQEWCLKISI